MTTTQQPADHQVVGDMPPMPPRPLSPPSEPARRQSAAEEARTIVATHRIGYLASLSEDGTPWASMVSYGALPDGSPVLYVSTLAEHGRNLARDPRASLAVSAQSDEYGDPLDSGRVTLSGRAVKPEGAEHRAALDAHVAAMPSAQWLAGFGDFSLYVLRVDRVRWVGGYGRMDSADAEAYAAASPDPVADIAARAVAHLNNDHADALLEMARAIAGYTDATWAVCSSLDRYGLDLKVQTPRGRATTRVGFLEPAVDAQGLRQESVKLARKSRGEAIA
jgi:putative heme iron utilization protein